MASAVQDLFTLGLAPQHARSTSPATLATCASATSPEPHPTLRRRTSSYCLSPTSTGTGLLMAQLNRTWPPCGMARSGVASGTRQYTRCRGWSTCSKVKKATTESSRRPLPITPTILRAIKAVWQKDPSPRDARMLWAPSCLCFFWFLRSGEIVCPTETSFDPQSHLAFADVAVDSRSAPSAMQVRIKASKTDFFRQRVTLHIGVAEGALCPVAAVVKYMVSRGGDLGPLFTWADGRFLTRDRFVAGVRVALTSAGYTAADYVCYSFWIGAAATASQRGIQDSLIQTLGRWQSSAYTRYIRTAPETLQRVANTLARD